MTPWKGLDLFADFPITGSPSASERKRVGHCTSVRGAQKLARKHPTAKRFILCGTVDELDRVNTSGKYAGLYRPDSWTTYFDLITRNVPLVYEIIKETAP